MSPELEWLMILVIIVTDRARKMLVLLFCCVPLIPIPHEARQHLPLPCVGGMV
jgi:hypothetical protein